MTTSPAPSFGSSPRHVVVLGGGVIGLSCAYFLSRLEGVRVTVLEREPRHDAHSSGRSAEIQRVAVDDEITRAIGLRSAALLRSPASIGLSLNAPLVDDAGLLLACADDEPAWAAPLRDLGIARRIERSEFERRAPHFRTRARQCYWLPEAGHVDAPRLIAALARGALACGAHLLRSQGAASLVLDAGRLVGARTYDGQLIRCDDAVIAAGAWSRQLGMSVGADLPLRPTKRHLFTFPRDVRSQTAAEAQVPIVWDDTTGFYARPVHGSWCTSVSDVLPQSPHLLDANYKPQRDIEQDAIASFARHIARGESASPRPLHSSTGYRDLSPDDRPIMGPDPRVPGLTWCAGVGGHGITLSLGAGEALATYFEGRPSRLALASACSRFMGLADAEVPQPETMAKTRRAGGLGATKSPGR